MDKAIKLSLKTWYPKDHPLHLDPLHPAIGLAGEAGESLDLYKKERFKDRVSWWDCVHCNGSKKVHSSNLAIQTCFASCEYTPKILDELGDLWYYLRILTYQQNIEFGILKVDIQDDILVCLTQLNYHSSSILVQLTRDHIIPHYHLNLACKWLQMILRLLDCTLDQLTELNYEKLKDGDQNGWQKPEG